MKTNLLTNMSRSFHKVGFKFKKHSPEILVTAGVVGTVVGTVMACKATTKLSGILEESKKEIDEYHGYVETNGYSEKYTEKDYKNDLLIVYTQTGVKIAKLYAPAITVSALSLAAIVSSNSILRKRNVALAAAYTAIDKGFKEYRGRVVERFGEAIDRELKYNIKAKEIETTVTDENGEEKKQVVVADVIDSDIVDLDGYSDYAKFFDVGNPYWEKDPEYNLMFLKKQQAYANDKLRRNGYLFLNEVYEMIGIPKTKAGQVVGWIYDENCPNGDNYVDFNIYNIRRRANRDFVNGHEPTILLDFNVDGNIWDLM